ncbi:MAG: T9SS type A sorting domain-containing protein [Flavobacteriales bacterium]|nr:T9SS type A sorting domain-containing protein [Flavobacteriales bacterium]
MVMPDDHILVAGRFFTDSTLMGTNIASQGLRQLCMIDSTGAPVADFPMLRCEWPTDSEIYRISALNSGGYIISGRFQEVEGHPTNHVAKLHADFSVDTTFISPFAFTTGGVVFIQFIDAQDRILLTGSNAELTEDADTFPGLVRLLPDGSLDASFQIPEIVWVNPPTGIAYPIRPEMVVEDHDGTYIIVGQFQTVYGSPRKGLAKLSQQGELIEGSFVDFGIDEAIWGTWEAVPGLNKIVDVGDGKWLLGGRFSSFGGEPYSCLVRLQPAGFVGTDDRDNRSVLKLYPNPARQRFRIELPEGVEALQTVELCDMQGRAVRAWPAAHSPFTTGGLPTGMYVVRASGKNGVYTQKLILEP